MPSAAIVLTLDKDFPEAQVAYAKAKSGKALAREIDRLDTAARRREVTSITSFLSESQAVLIAQMKEEGFDPSSMRLPPEQWFKPVDGLKSVRALILHVSGNLNDFKQPNPILRDLQAAEGLLIAAEKDGAQFHFTRTAI